MTKLVKRRDIVILFDITDGNPNGDPDSDNKPRDDPETGHGYVSDVCIKRKIRNRVMQLKPEDKDFDIYVKAGSVLQQNRKPAYDSLDPNTATTQDTESISEEHSVSEEESIDEESSEEDNLKTKKKGGKKEPKENKKETKNIEPAKKWMMENCYDIRTFGAVMSTKLHNAGQVLGPVQVTFSKSIDPIQAKDITVTRMAVETQAESDKQSGLNQTFGKKYIVPYGLYRGYIKINPNLANKAGFSEEDYDLLIESLRDLFNGDQSSSRPNMTVRAILCFEHNNALGHGQSGILFDLIKVVKKPDILYPRSFEHYDVTTPTSLPQGVELFDLLNSKIKLA